MALVEITPTGFFGRTFRCETHEVEVLNVSAAALTVKHGLETIGGTAEGFQLMDAIATFGGRFLLSFCVGAAKAASVGLSSA